MAKYMLKLITIMVINIDDFSESHSLSKKSLDPSASLWLAKKDDSDLFPFLLNILHVVFVIGISK